MWHQKEFTSILSNLNNFHSLEVVDRVSETQFHVGENSNWIIWRLKGLSSDRMATAEFIMDNNKKKTIGVHNTSKLITSE